MFEYSDFEKVRMQCPRCKQESVVIFEFNTQLGSYSTMVEEADLCPHCRLILELKQQPKDTLRVVTGGLQEAA